MNEPQPIQFPLVLLVEEGELTFDEPMEIEEIARNIGPIMFPGPGEYRWPLWVSRELLAERRMAVIQLKDGD